MKTAAQLKNTLDSMTGAESNAVLTAKELANQLGISRSTLAAWNRQGCPRIPLGRTLATGRGRSALYKVADVIDWLKSGRQPQPTK